MSKFMDWMIYGKGYSMKNEDFNNWTADRTSRIFIWAFLVLLPLTISLIVLNFILLEDDCRWSFDRTLDYPIKDASFENISIKYTDLSDKEIKHFQSIFYDLNPIYLTRNKNFKVVKNPIQGLGNRSYGANYGDGELIIIRYLDNEDSLKTILCHELLHSYIIGEAGDNPEHQIVYDIGSSQICFHKS